MRDLKINRAALLVGCGQAQAEGVGNRLKFHDPILVEHYRDGKLIGKYETINDITNQGKNNIFDVYFNTVTQIANANWYLGLISAASFTAVAATDVMSSHAGWVEYTTVTQSTRVAWGSVTSSGQTVTNTTAVTYNISGSGPQGTVEGVFIVGGTALGTNAFSGTVGTLWATALFATPVAVNGGDTLKITYSVSA